MLLPNLAALFSFSPGKQLTDGGELRQLVDLQFGVETGIVATAGGGQANAYQLTQTFNEVETCETNADSVKLPLAIPSRAVIIKNNTGSTLAVFGSSYNPNTGEGDTIAASNSNTQQATGTGVSQVTTVMAMYVCTTAGEWKQGSMA